MGSEYTPPTPRGRTDRLPHRRLVARCAHDPAVARLHPALVAVGRPGGAEPPLPLLRRVRRARPDRGVLGRVRDGALVARRLARARRAGAGLVDRWVDGRGPDLGVLHHRTRRPRALGGAAPRPAIAAPAPRPPEHPAVDLRASVRHPRLDLCRHVRGAAAWPRDRPARGAPSLVGGRGRRARDRGSRDRDIAPRLRLAGLGLRDRGRSRRVRLAGLAFSDRPGAPEAGWSWLAVAAGIGFWLLARIESAREASTG